MNAFVNTANTLEALDVLARAYARKISQATIDQGYDPIALHQYNDGAGMPLFWKPRLKNLATGEKWIRSFSVSGDGFVMSEPDFKTVYPQGNGKKPLYNLPQLMDACATDVVYIVEGEQKADALMELGILATTSGGANTAANTDWQPLADHNICIWHDNDKAGLIYKNSLTSILLELNCKVSTVSVEELGLPVKGDVIDWLNLRDEHGLTTTAQDVLELPYVGVAKESIAASTAKPSSAASMNSSSKATDLASAIEVIDQAMALAEANESHDVGVLWENQTIAAFQLVKETDKPKWARLRARLKQIKALKLSDLEREISSFENNGGNVDVCSILIDIASSACEFAHDEDGEPYVILTEGNVRQCYSLNSNAFYEWLSHSFYKAEGTSASEQAIKAALSSLSGKAKFDGQQISVHTRVAKHDGAYWIDLCNDQWQAVKITAVGWQVINRPPVLFTRSSTMRALPTPVSGNGNLSALWKIANIAEPDRLMVVTWLLECLRPDTPYPVLEISGEQGSAKSSTQSALRDLIDPNKSNLRAMPKNKDDVFISAKNNHVVSFENVSHLSSDYQDAMCSLSTGAGYAGRTLYTNTEETVIELKKPIVLNGIPVLITAQDLLDRSVHIDCQTLKTTTPEVELEQFWQQHQAAAFTGLLDVFVKALAQLPYVDLGDEKLPRMADFTLFGEAVYQTYDKPQKAFLNDYRERRKDGVNRVIESSPVALAMLSFLQNHPEGYDGTVGGLLTELNEHRVDGDGWVKSAKGFGDAIQRLKPALKQIGIIVHKDKRTSDGICCSLHWDNAQSF